MCNFNKKSLILFSMKIQQFEINFLLRNFRIRAGFLLHMKLKIK